MPILFIATFGNHQHVNIPSFRNTRNKRLWNNKLCIMNQLGVDVKINSDAFVEKLDKLCYLQLVSIISSTFS